MTDAQSGLTTAARPFGELLREHRLAAGLAQETLAERARLSVETISALERGARQKPYLETIAQLAEALELSRYDRAQLERAAKRRTFGALGDPALRNNLPVQLSSFVGRENDVAKVKEILAGQRLLTLVGAGGVGKTRVALRVATESFDGPHDYIWFVDLSTYSDSPSLQSAVGSAVGLQRGATLDSVIAYLQSKSFLLLLDNCEHLIGGVADAVTAILCRCPAAKILATSRQGLALAGERIYRVPPLSFPNADAGCLSADEARKYDAIRLFSERAEAADSLFELTPLSIPAVVEICRRVDGIPLAIELVAARSSAFSPATIVQLLDEHFLTLGGGGHALLPRHKTMRTLFDWSYNLLDELERRVFRRLAVFSGGFALELVTTVCADDRIKRSAVVDALASLVDKSLVQADAQGETTRYTFLEPTRQYAGERLRENDEEDSAARAHALALLAHAEEIDSLLELLPDRDWANRMAQEGENYRAAFEWALGPRGDAQIAQRLAGSRNATWFGFVTGDVRQWVAAAFETLDAETPGEVRAKLELSRARVMLDLEGQFEAAIDAAQRAASYLQIGHLDRAAAGLEIGLALMQSERIQEAEACLHDALETARSGGAKSIVPAITQALATARALDGDLEGARVLGWEGLRLLRAAGCERHAARDLPNLAESEFAIGDAETALQLAREAAAIFRANRTWTYLGWALANASVYLMALQRLDEARASAHEALNLALESGSVYRTIWALQHLAALDTNYSRAAHLLGFVDARLAQNGRQREYTERYSYDRAHETLRNAFGAKLDELVAEGKRWSQDRAIAEALEIL